MSINGFSPRVWANAILGVRSKRAMNQHRESDIREEIILWLYGRLLGKNKPKQWLSK